MVVGQHDTDTLCPTKRMCLISLEQSFSSLKKSRVFRDLKIQGFRGFSRSLINLKDIFDLEAVLAT